MLKKHFLLLSCTLILISILLSGCNSVGTPAPTSHSNPPASAKISPPTATSTK